MRGPCLTVLLFLCACPFGGTSGADPCNDDANACTNGGALRIDATCDLNGPLALELGGGEGEFQTLAPGVGPDLVWGLQGGSHMVLGLGIDNPSAEHLAFEVAITLSADLSGEIETIVERTVVYDEALVEFDAGRAELLNLVVLPDSWPTDERRWISATVTDACGRVGTLDHAIEADEE